MIGCGDIPTKIKIRGVCSLMHTAIGNRDTVTQVQILDETFPIAQITLGKI